MACASPEVEAEGSSPSAIATDRMGSGKQGQPRKRVDPGKRIDQLQVTHYTLPSEEDFEDEDDFLCSGRGWRCKGPACGRTARLVRYEGGGGAGRRTTAASRTGVRRLRPGRRCPGSSGRTLTEHYSIAVDERVIPMAPTYGSRRRHAGIAPTTRAARSRASTSTSSSAHTRRCPADERCVRDDDPA